MPERSNIRSGAIISSLKSELSINTMTRIENLVSIDSPPLGGELPADTALPDLPWLDKVMNLLKLKNGFYAFESALHADVDIAAVRSYLSQGLSDERLEYEEAAVWWDE